MYFNNSYKIMQDCWEYDPQDRPSFDLISYRLETLSKSKLVSDLNITNNSLFMCPSFGISELH